MWHVHSPRTARANQAILCIAIKSENFCPARFYIGSMYCVLRTNHAKFAKETSANFRNIQHYKKCTPFFRTEYRSFIRNGPLFKKKWKKCYLCL